MWLNNNASIILLCKFHFLLSACCALTLLSSNFGVASFWNWLCSIHSACPINLILLGQRTYSADPEVSRSLSPDPPLRRTWKSCVGPLSLLQRSWTYSTAHWPRRSWCPIPRPCAGTTFCPGLTRAGWGGPRPSSTSRRPARHLPRRPWFFSVWVREASAPVFRRHTWARTGRDMIKNVWTLTRVHACMRVQKTWCDIWLFLQISSGFIAALHS